MNEGQLMHRTILALVLLTLVSACSQTTGAGAIRTDETTEEFLARVINRNEQNVGF